MSEYFKVTRIFLSGNLKDIQIDEITSVPFIEGKEYKGSYWSEPFRILKVEPSTREEFDKQTARILQER
jgi:hypothetical protein